MYSVRFYSKLLKKIILRHFDNLEEAIKWVYRTGGELC